MLSRLPPVDPFWGLLVPLAAVSCCLLAFAALEAWLTWRARMFPFRELMVGLTAVLLAVGGMTGVQVLCRGRNPVAPAEALATILASIVVVVVLVLFVVRGPRFAAWTADVADPSALAVRIDRMERQLRDVTDRLGHDERSNA